jgi:5-deoxy-D-glucuronate isomerase
MTTNIEAEIDRLGQEVERGQSELRWAGFEIVSLKQAASFAREQHSREKGLLFERIKIRDERIESDGNTILALTRENAILTTLNESYAAMLRLSA